MLCYLVISLLIKMSKHHLMKYSLIFNMGLKASIFKFYFIFYFIFYFLTIDANIIHNDKRMLDKKR
jgi:hypothetical protein